MAAFRGMLCKVWGSTRGLYCVVPPWPLYLAVVSYRTGAVGGIADHRMRVIGRANGVKNNLVSCGFDW